MNYSKKIFALVSISAILFFLTIEAFAYVMGYEQAKTQSYESDKLIFDNLILSQEENLKILSNVLTLDENVKQAFRENDPEIIKKYIAPIWEKTREDELVYEIHFFKPPAISFVNFSNFKSIGTDVSDVRTDIAWITESFKPSYHALMCKTYAGYRATVPIIDNDDTMLGGLSIGKTMDWIPRLMKERTKRDSFLVYVKSSTSTLMAKYYDAFVKDKEIVGDYILSNQTRSVNPNLIGEIDFSLKSQDIVVEGKKYLLNVYPIVDFNQNTMAYECELDDLDGFFEEFYNTLLYDLALIFITAIGIFAFLRRSLSMVVKKIEYIAQLSDNIKKRDFEILHRKRKKVMLTNYDKNLDILQEDIIAMGLEIEKKYNTLEGESNRKTELLVQQLYVDKLTKLLNRSALFRDLEIYKDSYLAILNVKSFKSLNEVFGFESGNLILQQLSNHLEKINYKKDMRTYRVGNDEFAIVNYVNASKSDFEEHIGSIIQKIEEENFYVNEYEDSVVEINAYAGISFEKDNKLSTADVALGNAKRKNKDYAIYDEDASAKKNQANNMLTIRKVKHALENDDILVYFQPIVDKDGVINKYEALVRMRDGDKIVSPYFFLAVSQSTKYYHYITERVILKTFETFKDRDEMFSINLVAQDIMDEEIVSLIFDRLKTCKNVTKVVFEIVESEDVYDVQEVSDFIRRIKEIGSKIAIDDFGTGFSNFSYIMQIRPDFLKIDGSIIKNIDKDESAKQITKTIVSFAKELNIKTIAEYVYSEEIYKLCEELGVDEYQGYYFSEPIAL